VKTILSLLLLAAAAAHGAELLAFSGAYTDSGGGKGISAYRYDTTSGALKPADWRSKPRALRFS
jgi:hypothetical protein